MKIGIAVLGVGRWGVHWVRNFLHHPQAEIVAIVDPDISRLNYCCQELGIDEKQVLFTTDWQAIKQLNNLTGIVVATPAITHYKIIQDALNSGYHVLAEKPLTLNPQESISLSQLAKDKQLQLLVDHTYLFNAAVQKGKEVVESGKLGNLRYGYSSRTHLAPVRQDVDALWDLAIHDIAIFNAWLAESPSQVQAKGTTWLQPKQTMEFGESAIQVGLPDLVWLTLIYPSGFVAYIHLCWLNQDKQRKLVLVGEKASLIFDELAKKSPLTLNKGYFQKQGAKFIPQGVATETIEFSATEPLASVCDRFIQNIQTPQANENYSSGYVAAELVQILTCLSHSLAENGKITDVPKINK